MSTELDRATGTCHLCYRDGFKLDERSRLSRHGYRRYPLLGIKSGQCRGSWKTEAETISLAIEEAREYINSCKLTLSGDLVAYVVSRLRTEGRRYHRTARERHSRNYFARAIRSVRGGNMWHVQEQEQKLRAGLDNAVQRLSELLSIRPS